MTTVEASLLARLTRPLYTTINTTSWLQLNDAPGGSSTSTTGWYNNGNKINIAATANAGWEFVSWDGAGNSSYTGPQKNETVSLTSPANETAIFYAGLAIYSGPNGICRVQLRQSVRNSIRDRPAGDKWNDLRSSQHCVLISRNPHQAWLYVFYGWTGYTKASSVSALIDVNIPKSIKAAFVLDYADITVFGIVTAGVIVLSVGAFPVRFKIRELFPEKTRKFLFNFR